MVNALNYTLAPLPLIPGLATAAVHGTSRQCWAVLGVAVVQRIYVWRPVGPSVVRPGRKAVHFALSPPPGAETATGYSLTVRRAGENLSAAMARQYCHDSRFDEFPWRRWP